MKKFLPIVAVIIPCFCVIAAAATFFVLRSQNSTFTLINDSGKISIKTSPNGNYVPMTDPQADYPSGTFVKTDATSAAEVILPDNSVISLDESTEVQINYQSNNVDIQQLVGKTWNRVETVTKGGSYTVTTPTTVAAVRGTIFGVDALVTNSISDSQIYVQESNVDVSRIERVNGTINVLEKQSIAAGELIHALKDSSGFDMTRDNISDALKNSNWFKRNLLVDDIYKEIKNRRGNIRTELKTKLEENHPKLLQFIQNRQAVSLDTMLTPGYPNLSDFSTTSCTGFDSTQTEEYIASLDQYASMFGAQYGPLVDFLKAYGKDCTDGVLDSNEVAQLQAMAQTFNQP